MIDSTTLLKLSKLGLTTEQMAAVLELLAEAVQPLEGAIRDLEALRSANRERQRRYYNATHNVKPNVSLTLAGEKEGEISLEVENKIPPNPPQTSDLTLGSPEPTEFAEFWEAYPPRQGSKDRKAAVKAFRAAIKRETFATILAGAKAYRSHLQSQNKLNTEFVKQARTWLNADGWKEDYAAAKTVTFIHKNSPQPHETRAQYIKRLVQENQNGG